MQHSAVDVPAPLKPAVAGRYSGLRKLYLLQQAPDRFVSMEGLRGLAVILVFWVHFDTLFSTLAPSSPVTVVSRFLGIIGRTGPDLFFVLSGYLIYGALIRKRVSYGSFLVRRCQRIYPTFLAVFALYMVLSFVVPSENKMHGSFASVGWYIIRNVLFLPGVLNIVPIITVAWTLSYEFFFYLSLPLLIAVARMRARSSGLRLGFIVLLWLACLFCPVHPRMSMFFAGMALFEASTELRRWKFSLGGELLSVAALLLALINLYFHPDIFTPHFSAGPVVATRLVSILFLGAAFFCFCACCVCHRGWLARCFSFSPLRALGNMSYSYYLIHSVTLKAISRAASFLHLQPGISFYVLLAVSVAASWLAATALFMLIEKPLSLSPGTLRARLQRLRLSPIGEWLTNSYSG